MNLGAFFKNMKHLSRKKQKSSPRNDRNLSEYLASAKAVDFFLFVYFWGFFFVMEK